MPVDNFFLISNILARVITFDFLVTSLLAISEFEMMFRFFSESGQPFRSQFVLCLALWTGLAGATRLTRSDFMLHIGSIYFY